MATAEPIPRSFSTATWRWLCAAAALVLYAVSVSGEAYEVTSPVELPHHVLLRKIYALGAFALLGFLFTRARVPRAGSVAAASIAITLYSYAIELGQIVIDHSGETFAEHGFDVASGLAGGALGAWIALGAARAPRARAELAAIAAVFAALAWLYALSYGRIDR